MDRLVLDLKEGFRRLARRPGYALVASGTLALGLAASTAAFTYVSAYGRPFPGVGVDRLHQVWLATDDAPWGALSLPDYEDLATLDGAPFSVTAAGASFFLASVRHPELTEVAEGEAVAGGFFSLLGVDMSLGRGLSPQDDRPAAAPVAVISHDYWTSRYGADPAVAGRTILLNNEAYTLVGVVGPEFRGSSAASRPQFWLPFEQYMRVYRPGEASRIDREAGGFVPIIRLAEGMTATAAEDALAAFASRLDRDAPLADRRRTFALEPATWIRPGTREAEAVTTRVLVAAAGFLLLLACANVANLVLSAGARRHREIAIRRTLGASRGNLVGQLLVESLLLSVPAGLVGLALARPAGMRLSSYFARPSVWGVNVPRDIQVDGQVLVFVLLLAVGTAAVTGLTPALRTWKRSPARALGGSDGRSAVPGRRPRERSKLRDALVSIQVAICIVLVFVAALVLRTLDSATSQDPGFDASQLVASYVSTSSMGIPVAERHQFFQELILRFRALAWVESATVAEYAPLSGHPTQRLAVGDGVEPVAATVARVWPGYFEAAGMDIVAGRTILSTDSIHATDVVVVNESFAARIAGGQEPLGRALVWPGTESEVARAFEVVGVVRDARQVTLLDPPGPVAYFSLPQHYSRPGNALLLRVRGDPTRAAEFVERELRRVSSRIAIVNILPYRDVVRGELYTQRMNAELFTLIAALGLLLSVAGVFAVLTLAIVARRREIAIRMAVGAGSPWVARALLRPIGRALLMGLGVGLVGASWAGQLVESLLWGVRPADPLALAGGLAVLLVAVVAAIAIPLRVALNIDPAASLRME